MSATLDFVLPQRNVAHAPPERRGVPRDQVRLLILDRRTGEASHGRFDRLGDWLRPGDLLVFNASATLPAELTAQDPQSGTWIQVRLAQHAGDGTWLALLTGINESTRTWHPAAGLRINFGDGLAADVLAQDDFLPRLWRLRFSHEGAELLDRLHRLGRPIRYEYVSRPWPLEAYQTVYARVPGSAEMPSAGRAFTWRLIFGLRRRGIETTSVVLHTGLSSYLDNDFDSRHPVAEEEYLITPQAADRINRRRAAGGRVIAVGTTAVRALESAADDSGRVPAGRGYTRLKITADYRLRAADGLLTGLHEPEASHLDLLAAFAPARFIRDAYAAALEQGYLWHEFGDLNLIV